MVTLRSGHQIQLLQGAGEFFPALVRAIDASVREVRLETYIFDVQAQGQAVAGALERAAQRGVEVYLVVDGVGTPSLPEVWQHRFRAAGVQWRIFSPLGRLGILIPSRWRRLHRKLCVVDGELGFCGGINVLDDLYDPNHGTLTAPRFDFAVQVRGPLVQDMHEVLALFWLRLQAAHAVRLRDFAVAWQAIRTRSRPVADRQTQGEGVQDNISAGLILRDNLRNRARIERNYRKAIGEAQHEIIIANAYFLPGAKLRNGLIHAARRGVRVRLLLQGRYEYFMQYHAAQPVYDALLAAGIEIHAYSVSFLHAKVAVIDGHWATVGSSNLDPLSLLLAREANVVVDDPAFAQNLRARLVHAMEREGVRVDPDSYANRPWRERLLDYTAYALMRILLFLYGKRY